MEPKRIRRALAGAGLSVVMGMVFPLALSGPIFAASIAASVTPTLTSVTNSYLDQVSVSGIASGDEVSVQIYNAKTYKMAWQTYQTSTGSTFKFSYNTISLPADQSYTYSIYIYSPGWTTRIYSATGLDPFTTSSTAPTNLSQAEAYYPNWIRQFVQPASTGLRVVDPDMNDVTVSEGQGYGMLISALANDKSTFSGLWQYAEQHLDQNGLMNWEISSSGATIGATSATNGDEAMAEGLLIAGARWPGLGFTRAGTNMANAIYSHDLVAGTYLIGPGDDWNGTSSQGDMAPGYIDPYAYKMFAIATGNPGWTKVLSTNESWLGSTGSNSATGLIPDWETTTGAAVTPPGSQNPVEAHEYYENAVPYPIWWVQAAENGALNPLATKLADFFASNPLSDGYTLGGATINTGYINMPFLSGITTLLMAVDPSSPAALQDYNLMLSQQANTYYGSTLEAMALFMLANPSYPAIQPPPPPPAPQVSYLTLEASAYMVPVGSPIRIYGQAKYNDGAAYSGTVGIAYNDSQEPSVQAGTSGSWSDTIVPKTPGQKSIVVYVGSIYKKIHIDVLPSSATYPSYAFNVTKVTLQSPTTHQIFNLTDNQGEEFDAMIVQSTDNGTTIYVNNPSKSSLSISTIGVPGAQYLVSNVLDWNLINTPGASTSSGQANITIDNRVLNVTYGSVNGLSQTGAGTAWGWYNPS